MTQGWNLIYTKPKHEKKLAGELSLRNIEYFLPCVKVEKQWRDRKKIIDEVLFPSYIFVRTANKKDFFELAAAPGYCGYVKFGKVYASVSQLVIDQIKVIISSQLNTVVTSAFYQPGQRIVVNEGPLSGLCGEVVKNAGEAKILVRMEILNRCILVDMPAAYLL